MKKFAVIVAGGSGKRMGSDIPKQFLEVGGKPVLMHTFDVFYAFDPNIEFIFVLPENQINTWNLLCEKHSFEFEYRIAFGGETRFQSVKNGLKCIKEDGIVFIQDAVRPFVSHQTLKNCYKTTVEKGNALPVIPIIDSVRMVNENGNHTVDRSKYFMVQTPQTFQVNLIKNAYQNAENDMFTDDASVFESAGGEIYTVDGNRENIKITTPVDIIIAEAFVKKM